MKKCVICDKDFEAKRADAKICSSMCRQKAKRAGIKFRGQDAPQKLSPPPKIDPVEVQKKIAEVKKSLQGRPRLRGAASTSEFFMGHEIPTGLKGIDLSIWKAEIKEKSVK